MRFLLVLAGSAALLGCSPPVPDSARGVGFTSMEQLIAAQDAARAQLEADRAARAAREAALSGTAQVPVGPPATVDASLIPQAPGQVAGQIPDVTTPLATVPPQPVTIPANALPGVNGPVAPVATTGAVAAPASPIPARTPASPPTPIVDAETGAASLTTSQVAAEISDEQNFDAVADRETIESDAARIAANRALYRVVQPTDLPTRDGQAPNIVQYALLTNHPVGAQLYNRFYLQSRDRYLRNCAGFASNDLAQQEFLAQGGPERDRARLDPDGDGYACRWDPTPFRVLQNN